MSRVHPFPQARRQAQQLVDDGDLTGARRVLEEACAAGQRLGPGDPLMVLLAYDLAVVSEELANRHEARKNFALVAEFGPGALGEEHPAVAHARDYVSGSRPTSPSPVSPPPASFPPASALPVSALPGEALPTVPLVVSTPPVSASPVSVTPTSPPPWNGPPPVERGAARSRTRWVIAAAAVVFAVVTLVVVFVRPGAEPAAVPVAAASPTDAPVSAAPSSSAAASSAAAASTAPTAAAATTRPAAGPRTTAPRPAAAVASRIVTPKNGSGVARGFTVTFSVSAADVRATATRLVLTVCVKQWCFLDGPVVIKNGAAEDYTVVLGTKEGAGLGEKWTVRVDRLSQAAYGYLAGQKQTATDAGTWGNGVTTPKDRLNKIPVSAVVLTKTS